MSMLLRAPYQCLQEVNNLLVAARGSSIDLFSLEDLSLLSTWNCPITQASNDNDPKQSTNQQSPDLTNVAASQLSPPAKRRKLSDDDVAQDADGAAQRAKKKQNSRPGSVVSGLEAPAVTSLATTKSGQHVIAVTGEDKSIRVFEIAVNDDEKRYLKPLSRRAMPKRPCALAIANHDSTIIAADKFGDVYSLPLLFSESESSTTTPRSGHPLKPFVPAANNLTVHSQRNRKALENQKSQKNRASEKFEPTFEHKLLLGHVSLLTDVVTADIRDRSYIVTADRDEHIRVSRGIPQSHIIEGFCLGHAEFVSRLCIPSGRPNLLISGGGDGELYLWDWLSGRLTSKTDLESLIINAVSDVGTQPDGTQERNDVKVAVSNILYAQVLGDNGNAEIILVTSEGVPALFSFIIKADNTLQYSQTIHLPGNALDLAVTTSLTETGVVVSVDNVHKPSSTTELRLETSETVEQLLLYKFRGQELVAASSFSPGDGREEVQREKLTNLLYNLENLRKREGEAKDIE